MSWREKEKNEWLILEVVIHAVYECFYSTIYAERGNETKGSITREEGAYNRYGDI